MVTTTYLTGHWVPRPENLVDDRLDAYTGRSPLTVWLGQLIENGLSEELFFRGPLLAAAVACRWARIQLPARMVIIGGIAIGWSTVTFAYTHSDYGMWNVVPALASGLVLSGLILLTRTIWTTAIAHTTYNSWIALGIVF